MELINGNSEIIKDFFQSMEKILGGIGKLAKEHSDKRQNNLPSKRYRTAFADLLQQGTAEIIYHS